MAIDVTDPSSSRASGRLLRYAVRLAVVGGAYYVTARLSLTLSLVGESVTPLWPPTGIALVALLVLGYRVWPALTTAAFLVNVPISPDAETAGFIALGNTLAPVIAAGLLRVSGFRRELDRTRDALGLVLLGALAGMTVSATIGTLALESAGAVSREDFWSSWAVWWAGDAMGILAVAPFLLGLRTMRLTRRIAWLRVGEIVLLFGALAATALLLTTTMRPVWVAAFPLLILIAGRFQQRGAGPAALLVIATAAWAAAQNEGPFAGSNLLEKMVALQVFNSAVALTSFFFAAVVAERIAARREVERSARDLYQREHRIAATLQRSLLPDALPDIPDVAITARYLPATSEVEVGGDWYDIIPSPDGRIGVVIGDVAGHGVSAAAVMGQIRMALRAYALEGLSPGRALERLNVLIMELQPGAMATLVFAQLDPETGSATLAKAGHPPPLVVSPPDGTSYVMGGLAPPLGVTSLATFEETTVQLAPGTTLLLYTDGLIERRAESLDEGLERLRRAIGEAPEPLDGAVDHIIESLVGADATDDTAVLAIRRVALRGRPLSLSMPAQPGRLGSMRRVVGRWLTQNGANDDEAADVLVACTEACSNVMLHAYGAKGGTIDIKGTTYGDVIEITISDYGSWRPPAALDGGATGHGINLMRAVVDDLNVIGQSDGTRVRLTKRIRSLVANG